MLHLQNLAGVALAGELVGEEAMKYGINLYLWADEMSEGLLPVLESLKAMGYDGVEVPIFDLDQSRLRLGRRGKARSPARWLHRRRPRRPGPPRAATR